jgi:hypothetical protein
MPCLKGFICTITTLYGTNKALESLKRYCISDLHNPAKIKPYNVRICNDYVYSSGTI